MPLRSQTLPLSPFTEQMLDVPRRPSVGPIQRSFSLDARQLDGDNDDTAPLTRSQHLLPYDMDIGISSRLLERQQKSQIADGRITILCITWNVGNAAPRDSEVRRSR